jgi:hypothetical protein
MASHNSSQVVDYIESWVRSEEAMVDVEQVSLEVLSIPECPVGLFSLSEGECGRRRIEGTPTLSLVSQDPSTIQCVQDCLSKRGTQTCGN